MNKNNNNKVLLAILVLLALVFVSTYFVRNRMRSERSLRTELVKIDSASVEEISIFPHSTGEEIKFTKLSGKWQVESKGVTSEPAEGAVARMLAELRAVVPKRLVSRSKEQWEKYALTDSLATRVKVMETGKGQTLNLYIGKFNYRQPAGGMNQLGGNRGFSGITYVRLGDENEVYATEGFLAMSFNQRFNSWRNAVLLKTEKPTITRLLFNYPKDSGFVLLKKDSVWMLNDEKADSAAVEDYLNMLTNKQGRNFADQFTPDTTADITLIVSGNSMNDITLDCWVADSGQYYLHSSYNPNSYFSSQANGLFAQLFVRKAKFIPKK